MVLVNLTEHQQQVQSLARDVSQRELAPKAAEIDRSSQFPREGLKKLAEVGLMGMGIPESFGGSQSDMLSYVLAVEEIARACASTAEILVCHVDASRAIVAGGTDEAKKRYLTGLGSGSMLAAFALTEPGSGTNPYNLEASASPEDGYYVVNGSKVFITSGEEADVYVTAVRTNPQQPGPTGQSYLVIDKGTAGFTFGTRYDRMGFRGTASRELIFDNCRVPRGNLLGAENGFMGMQMAIGGQMQLSVAATSLGIAAAALEAAMRYARERLQVGKQPLMSYQAVKFMLVDMSTAVDAARAMVHRAAAVVDSRRPGPPIECLEAKLFVTETAVEVADRALQIHGGTGYCRDLPVERYYRDARGLTLHGLATEMQKENIAMFLLA
ncbi:MAG: acyl-CoA dehydrogenase family protein [Chloroflexota bacterium]